MKRLFFWAFLFSCYPASKPASSNSVPPSPTPPTAPLVSPDAGTDKVDPQPACLPKEATLPLDVETGKNFLASGDAGGPFLPRLVFDNLWRLWTFQKPPNVAQAMRERYGFLQAPDENDGLPWGMHARGFQIQVDCLLCHAGEVAGQPVLGAANTQLDLELFVEDLSKLAKLLGQTVPNAPKIHTGAKGVNDIVGMTLQLGLRNQTPPEGVNLEIGFQDAPAWWTFGDKTRMFTDGSGPQSAHRSMMATQLAFGTTQEQLEALEPQYIALRKYLLTLPAPVWPFEAPSPESVLAGQKLFRQKCTACHRDDRCEKAESVIVPRETVGTDPERSLKYGEKEIALINNSYFGADEPHRATTGYIAPSLKGVWASAPYFHNGAVPTLEGVLSSSKRPKIFRILGTKAEHYDAQAVGLKTETLDEVPPNLPRAQQAWYYDTRKTGLGNQGHTFGDSLTDTERRALLDFLKTQ